MILLEPDPPWPRKMVPEFVIVKLKLVVVGVVGGRRLGVWGVVLVEGTALVNVVLLDQMKSAPIARMMNRTGAIRRMVCVSRKDRNRYSSSMLSRGFPLLLST